MQTTRLFILTSISFLILGCGGGGGGSDSVASETPAPTPTPAPPQGDDGGNSGGDDDAGAADIEVPEGFDFATSQPIAILVDVGSSFSSKLYLTVCRDHDEATTGRTGPDYEQCLTRTPVTGGTYQGKIDLPNDIESLTATLWSFDPAEPVKNVSWRRDRDNLAELRIE